MTPQTVNAVNLPLQNALNFPAAILQPPFFDPQAPAAANYGAIGSVIGHEISHTFDTEGSSLRLQGPRAQLVDAFRPGALRGSHREACRAIRRLSALPGSAPERQADAGGEHRRRRRNRRVVRRLSMPRSTARRAPEQDGFTGDQQFFIAFGQNYASQRRATRRCASR